MLQRIPGVYTLLLIGSLSSVAVMVHPAQGAVQYARPVQDMTVVQYARPVQGGTAAFYENRGQIADGAGRVAREVVYQADFGNARVYVTRQGWYTVYYGMADAAQEAVSEATGHAGDRNGARELRLGEEREAARVYRLGVLFEGSDPDVAITAEFRVQEYRNYYLGHCPEGITDVPGYRVLRFRNL